MIGERIESRASIGIAPLIFGLAGLALLGIALLAGTPHPAIFAILPFALGLAALLTGEPAVAFTIAEEGITFEQPDLGLIRYSDLSAVTAPVSRDPGDRFTIQLYHTTGVVRIPGDINVSSQALHDFLVDRLPPLDGADPRRVPAKLRAFVADQIQLFGAEKVFVYRARSFEPQQPRSPKVGYAMAVVCSAAAWCIIGIVLEEKKLGEGGVWAGFGCMISFLGLLFAFLLSRANTLRRPAHWRESCVVVSPGGIAMMQGTLRGKMRWDELRSIDYPAKPRFGLSTHGGARSGIGLLTDGAYFIIADLYDRPLAEIRRTLSDYWGGRDAN